MVSMSKPQTFRQAKGYLTRENYYQKNSEMGQFHGDGLAYVGLQNGQEVTTELYEKLLNGYHPISGGALVKNAGKENRRVGMDVTFSAPKSVSVVMEFHEAEENQSKANLIRKAHQEAVSHAMKQLENRYAKTRIYNKEGERIKVDAALIFATFEHDTSREIAGQIDPQLHSHNFIFSTVFYEDSYTGEVRKLSLSNEEIYQNKMYLGQIYRSELAKNLSDIGYSIEVSDRKNGFFEIEGFNEMQLEEFSQRSKKIRELLPQYREKYPKMDENELLQLIVKDTKKAKKEIDREGVREVNLERMGAVGIDKNLIDSLDRLGNSQEINPELINLHLEKSLSNLTEKMSVFSYEELVKNTLKYGLEYGYTEDIYQEYIAKSLDIVRLDKNVFSTPEMIKAEKNIILSVHEEMGKSIKFSDYGSEKVTDFIAQYYSTMTEDQKKMMRFALGSNDRFTAIQGDAGTGKTYVARALNDYLKMYHPDQKIIGISFTGQASQGLETDSKIKSKTVHSFLANELKNTEENRVIIVDEAGMIGSLQMNELVENAKKKNDKIIFIGDKKQFKSISAGNIFSDMQRYGIKTVSMTENLRQETDLTKRSVAALKAKEVEKSINILKEAGRIHEDDRDSQIEEIVKNYTTASPKKQHNTLIITSTNRDKESINTLVRKHLGRGGAEYTTRERVNVSGIEGYYSEAYRAGDYITVKGEIEGTKRGQNFIILDRVDDKIIKVKSMGRQPKVLDINVFEHAEKLEVFHEKKKSFTKGDVIVFTKNTVLDQHTRTSIKNGERTRIKKISKSGDVVTENGKKFNLNEMPYIDYGYAITDVKSQGQTTKNVIIMANSAMAKFNAFYTQITRAKKDITLYTDNLDQLSANVAQDKEEISTLNYTIKIKEKKDDRSTIRSTSSADELDRGEASQNTTSRSTDHRQRGVANEGSNDRTRQENGSDRGLLGTLKRVKERLTGKKSVTVQTEQKSKPKLALMARVAKIQSGAGEKIQGIITQNRRKKMKQKDKVDVKQRRQDVVRRSKRLSQLQRAAERNKQREYEREL